jgi:transposase
VASVPTVEELLAEREALLQEREQWHNEREELLRHRSDDRGEIRRLQQIIASLRHKLFGSARGEVVNAAQLELALAKAEGSLIRLEAQEVARELRRQKESAATDKEPVRRARFVFPEQVEEVTERIEPAEVQAEPQAYRQIGEEVTELLDIEPMRFIKKRMVRPRYVRIEAPEEAPICAPLPRRVIPGGLPTVRLLVHVLLAKYVDHLPLYRISGIFRERYGVRVSRQTLADWIRMVAEDWLALIYYSIKSDLQHGDYLQVDETPICCNDPQTKGRSRKGYLWTYVDAEAKVFYDWHMSRSKTAARSMLGGFRGQVQCDGYSVYGSLAQEEGFTLIGCMAHVRRKFYEAFELHGEDASAWYLVQIKALYQHERDLRAADADPVAYRQRHSAALMQALGKRLEEDRQMLEQNRRSPKTLEAIKYALGQWDALLAYLDCAQAQIDNNRAEQAIRPTKLGAKNWLFVGHPKAGKRSAIIYTLMQNCKNEGIEPQQYLTDVLERLPHCGSDAESARALQPRHWKKAQADS